MILISAVVVLVALGVSMARRSDLSPRPLIVLSLDRTLWHRLGLSRWTYVRAIQRAGARVRSFDFAALDNGESADEVARRLLEGADGLVLSGGGDVDPRLYDGAPESSLVVRRQRDRFELALLREAGSRGLPILGICRGAQLLNVWRGGTLRNLRSDPVLRRTHRIGGHAVELVPGSRLARLLETERIGRVVTYHGQAVQRLGDGLVVVGRAADGVVEAIELDSADGAAWIIGVQWHPELSPRSRLQRKLFAGLIEATGGRAAAR